MTKKIQEMVQVNSELLRAVPDAYGKKQLVVDRLSDLSCLDRVKGVKLFRESKLFYLEDEEENVCMPIYTAAQFFKEKASTLIFLKAMAEGE